MGLHDFRRPRLWIGVWVVLQLLTVVICVVPIPSMGVRIPFSFGDKLVHELCYFVLAGYAAMLFAARRALLFAAIGLFALGAAIEGVQAFLPWRSADVRDMLANGLGVLAGGLLAWTPLAYWLRWLDGGRAARPAQLSPGGPS